MLNGDSQSRYRINSGFFFRDLLPGGDGYVEDTSSKEDNEDNNSPDISLVTGRVRTGGQGKDCQKSNYGLV